LAIHHINCHKIIPSFCYYATYFYGKIHQYLNSTVLLFKDSGFAELFFSGHLSVTNVPWFFTCKLNKKGMDHFSISRFILLNTLIKFYLIKYLSRPKLPEENLDPIEIKRNIAININITEISFQKFKD